MCMSVCLLPSLGTICVPGALSGLMLGPEAVGGVSYCVELRLEPVPCVTTARPLDC